MDSENGGAQAPFDGIPGDNLVEVIIQSHKLLARVHEDELQEVRDRSAEIIAALRALEDYRAGIMDVMAEARTVTAEQSKLVNAWNGRHQDFLENFDKKSAETMNYVSKKHLELLTERSTVINEKTTKQFNSIIMQLTAGLQTEADALNLKVKDINSNAIHDLNRLSSAVRNATQSFHDQSLKLYIRVLVLSVCGAFTGTVAALVILHFWKGWKG